MRFEGSKAKTLRGAIWLTLACASSYGLFAADPATAPDSSAGEAAFAKVASVLRHPRCLNCHPAGDFPRQGDSRRPHAMKVTRGADNGGELGMRCSTCHAADNVGLIPGAPHWALAPRSMAWEGLSDAELAAALKDPLKNGNRSLADLDKHLAEDALVGWAWSPGENRQPPPLSRDEFLAAFRQWVAAGAPVPAPTSAP